VVKEGHITYVVKEGNRVEMPLGAWHAHIIHVVKEAT
jgi:hypothetical protein